MKEFVNRLALEVLAKFLKFHKHQTYIETFMMSKLEIGLAGFNGSVWIAKDK
jgi:hypothetical protein